MKKLSTLTLAYILTLSLTACGNSGNTPYSNTTTSPTATNPVTINQSPQEDVGFVRTEGNGRAFGRTSGRETNETQEDGDFVYAEDMESISIESISVDIRATNAYVLNTDTNSVLYEKNGDENIAPASTVKMLTALTALDYCAPDDLLTVGSEIDLIASDSSRAWLNQGDTLTVEQLLVALMLPSGNDAAYTLAVNAGRNIAGEDGLGAQQAVTVFVDAMNNKAKEVGAASSNFTTPDGYDADGQYTTASDLAQIAKACLDNSVLSIIMGSYKISDTWDNGREVTYTNTNELINPNSRYYYPGTVGLKTGSTADAGSCLVSAAYINEQTYICVVMGSSEEIRFTDSLAVFHAIDQTIPMPQGNNADPSAIPVGLGRR